MARPDNYQRLLFEDPLFWHSLQRTLYFAALALPLGLVFGFFLAILLNQEIPAVNLWRTIYFLPSVVAGVAVALLWMRLFNPRIGLINPFLENVFGIENPPGWLQDPQWAIPSLVIMSLWGVGGTMIIYLAGLQGIPTTLYEAAKIDGTNAWQRFRNVTLPLMTPVIFYNLVIGSDRLVSVLHRGLRGHRGPGRPRALDVGLQPVPLPERLQVFRDGLRLSLGLGPVPHRAGRHAGRLPLVAHVGLL